MSFIVADQINRPPTFEQRWEPVYEIDGGTKGDRLRPHRANPLANPRLQYRIAALECRSFCDFP